MKNIKFLSLLLAVSALLNFTSCSDDDNDDQGPVIEPPVNTFVISFDSISLPDTGYINNQVYKAQGITFSNSYSTSAYGEYWEGFSYSKLTDRTNATLTNQYSVFATGGADNSKQFAIAYAGYEVPTNFQADSGIIVAPASVMVNNSTYAALTMKDGNNFAKAFEAEDWFKVIFTGYDIQGKAGKTVEFYLADYRNNKTFICNQWTEVNLAVLGSVNKVTITFDSSDKGEFGINHPQYVCLDNLKFFKN